MGLYGRFLIDFLAYFIKNMKGDNNFLRVHVFIEELVGKF